jgi:hypothetical protein
MKNKINSFFILFVVLILTAQNSSAQEEILFRRHIINSGWNGFLYGGAIDVIAELDGGAAAGVPVITAGGCMLLPLLTRPERSIDYDAMVMNMHGKSIGWVHGLSLATLIGGEKAWESDHSNNYKYTVAVGALTSIGMGILGNSLARNHDWTEGQVELYRLYGWVGPFTGFSIMASFSDNPRLYGAAALVFGAGGYLVADKVNNLYPYTRGDMRATQVLTVMNTGLGYGIFADNADKMDEVNNPYWLIPAAGALSGALAGHLWLKNKNLTPKQGMLTVYAASGGAVVGLGIALITESKKITPYYLIPYTTSLAAYAITLELLGKKNRSQALLNPDKKNNFNFTFMPQNLLMNNFIQNRNYFSNSRPLAMQPLFVASLRF